MSRRLTAYYPLALTVLFGLVLSLLPISPALGDNIGACQGTTTSAKVSLGGRVMTPTLILRASGNKPCAANETNLSLVSLSRTIIVSPNGTPTQNGTTLLTAMTTISNSNPSASNPYLLKLEPGNYDLANQSLTLLPYVDLEGSGEDTTVISSTVSTTTLPPNTGTLVAASNSEVRFLKITNSSSSWYQTAVFIPSVAINVRFTHLTATSNSNFSSGLYNFGTITVQNSTFSTFSNGSNGYGFYNNSGVAIVQNSTISASSSVISNGFYNRDGTAIVQNSTISA